MTLEKRLHQCQSWAKDVLGDIKFSSLVQDVSSHPRGLLYASLSVFLSIFLASKAIRFFRSPAIALSGTPDLKKPAARSGSKFKSPDRKPGVWTPSDFKRPKAAPLPDWDVHTSKPLPYRPFRYGQYHITMGLRNMKWDEWIELDSDYLKYHADKAARIAARGSKCSHTDPAAYPAALEFLEELCAYLPERYPTMFRRTAVGIRNLVTGEAFDIQQRPLAEDPMQLAARLVQDDLAIMIEKADGQYYLLAGSVLLAGFWRLQDKLGLCLDAIHTSGSVPGYEDKLAKGMNNFFRRVTPEGPVVRNNYFIQTDGELPWSTSIGAEDGAEGSVGWFTAEKNRAIAQHYFRSERQTLRRLPRTGGVVFTIRTYFVPVTELVREPGCPGRLASAVRSWGEDVARYKGRERYQEVLLEYLDCKHKEQVETGVVVEEEEREKEDYPFFAKSR